MGQMRKAVLGFLVSSAALTSTGCVEWIGDQGILIIEAAEQPQAAGCVPQAQVGDVGNGVLDLLPERGYNALLRVVLNLPATFNTQRASQEQVRQPGWQYYGGTDTNVVIVDQVEVYFSDGENIDNPGIAGFGAVSSLDNAGTLPLIGAPRISPASGTIYNTQQTLNAFERFFANAITDDEAEIISNGRIGAEVSPNTSQRIVTNIRFVGYTTGGGQVRSSLFSYPIDLCRGCLFPPEVLADGACPVGTVVTNPACALYGQDAQLTCEAP